MSQAHRQSINSTQVYTDKQEKKADRNTLIK